MTKLALILAALTLSACEIAVKNDSESDAQVSGEPTKQARKRADVVEETKPAVELELPEPSEDDPTTLRYKLVSREVSDDYGNFSAVGLYDAFSMRFDFDAHRAFYFEIDTISSGGTNIPCQSDVKYIVDSVSVGYQRLESNGPSPCSGLYTDTISTPHSKLPNDQYAKFFSDTFLNHSLYKLTLLPAADGKIQLVVQQLTYEQITERFTFEEVN